MTVHAIRTQPQPPHHAAPEAPPRNHRERAGVEQHLRFHDAKLAEKFARGKVPITTLYEAYFDGKVDIPGDIYDFLAERDHYVKYEITSEHVKFLFKNFIPEATIHSKNQDRRIVRAHYDRGDDFFRAFLGDRMVYTSAYFKDGPTKSTLEEAQDEKMNRCCRKLDLKPGEKLADIGCGWGTLVRHAAMHYGADATGITISKNQTEFGNARIEKAGVADKARLLCVDYRDTPKRAYDKIVSLEMVEHAGVKNLPKYFSKVFELLKDDGRFLLQWTGLRRAGFDGVPPVGLRAEDMIWGLFMAKYIFPGADASLPLSDMMRYAEKAGFEIHSVENVSIHYAWTIKAWHDNWLANKKQILDSYGERWFRIWHMFLAWAVCIAKQGSAACFQVVFNKNRNDFDRSQYVGSDKL